MSKKCRSGGLSSCGDTISEFECKVLKEQIERRHKYRLQFLKERTDPCKHSMEAGYLVSCLKFIPFGLTYFIFSLLCCWSYNYYPGLRLAKVLDQFPSPLNVGINYSLSAFDPALQKFVSMKTVQLDHFKVNASTIRWALICVMPMFLYGAALWTERNEREMKIRSGKTRYRERSFKLI